MTIPWHREVVVKAAWNAEQDRDGGGTVSDDVSDEFVERLYPDLAYGYFRRDLQIGDTLVRADGTGIQIKSFKEGTTDLDPVPLYEEVTKEEVDQLRASIPEKWRFT